jgi:glycosyltransferase involved in cell wall biosynthesis
VTPPTNSLVITVYRSAGLIPALIDRVEHVAAEVGGDLEAVFVVDGSPDDSMALLMKSLSSRDIRARLVEHSRNFGALAAARTGLECARGTRIALMASDLQEPSDLVIQFFSRLASGEVDVVAGERISRDDRGDSAATLYWRLYRRFVMSDIPRAGVDVFACTSTVRDVVCSLETVHTSIISQMFWVGFRRELVPYHRLPSPRKSGWSLSRKLRYTADSVFAFTDLPVRMLWATGAIGLATAIVLGASVLIGRAVGDITVPGYAATVLVVIFFASLNLLGLGIVGSYAWRAYETVKGRPSAIVRTITEFPVGEYPATLNARWGRGEHSVASDRGDGMPQ